LIIESNFSNRQENVWGRKAPTHFESSYLFQIFSFDIATVYQFLLVVVDINADRDQQIGRYDLDAVIIGLGVIDLNGLALESLIDHLGGLGGQSAGVLEDGVALFAGDDRLDGSNFSILAGHNGAGEIGGAITNALEGGENTNAQTIIGREDAIDTFVGVIGAEEVVHASLGSCSKPAQGTDFVHTNLTTLDDDRAAVDERLDNGHGAIIEVESVSVVGGTTEEFNVEGTNTSGGCFAGFEAEAFEELGALNDADAKVIEGGVVIDVGGLGDQAVVGDDEDASIMSLLEHVGHGRAINGGDDENVRALGDHVFDLSQLIVDVVISKLQVGLVAKCFEGFDHALAVGDPAGRSLGRHRNAYHFGSGGGLSGRGSCWCAGAYKNCQHKKSC
jgi:hypothetical protein